MDELLAVSPLLSVKYRWPRVRCCVLADDSDIEGCADIQFAANQYTKFLAAAILCRCSPSEFSSEYYEFSSSQYAKQQLTCDQNLCGALEQPIVQRLAD